MQLNRRTFEILTLRHFLLLMWKWFVDSSTWEIGLSERERERERKRKIKWNFVTVGHDDRWALPNGMVNGYDYLKRSLVANVHLWALHLKRLFLNGPTPASFSFIIGLFKQTMQFLQLINVKNVHLVYGTGIRTHDLPSEHESSPITTRPGHQPSWRFFCFDSFYFVLSADLFSSQSVAYVWNKFHLLSKTFAA